jgi:glycogen debranching enzyme
VVLEEAYGDHHTAERLRREAERLAEQLEERFWWEAEGTYFLGLDGQKRPLATVASNPGHLLWAGAVEPGRAASVARRLLADDLWSGWGVRTLSADHPSYNPFSYQLGSVWPHDNSICAAGFRRYGHDEEATRVATGILEAAAMFQAHRLPELFAGLPREPGGFPVQYLGANVPQAWASGAVVQLVATLLGVEADAAGRSLRLRPALPSWLHEVRLENLRVGNASVDLRVSERDGGYALDVSHREGSVDVALVATRVPGGGTGPVALPPGVAAGAAG